MMTKLMKKAITVLMLFFFCFVFSQNKSKNIMQSSNTNEIEEFLKEAHPDDPRKTILKKKLVQLKNESWTKGAKDHKPMAPRIQEYNTSVSTDNQEAEEFKKLVSNDRLIHKERTVKFLDTIFNEDVESKEVILLVKNESDCNIIVRIQGKNQYSIPVYAHSENTQVLNKGEYAFKSNICGASYTSQKNITKNLEINLKKLSPHMNTSMNLSK